MRGCMYEAMSVRISFQSCRVIWPLLTTQLSALQTVEVNLQGVNIDQFRIGDEGFFPRSVRDFGGGIEPSFEQIPHAPGNMDGLNELYQAADVAKKVEVQITQKGEAAIQEMSQLKADVGRQQ